MSSRKMPKNRLTPDQSKNLIVALNKLRKEYLTGTNESGKVLQHRNNYTYFLNFINDIGDKFNIHFILSTYDDISIITVKDNIFTKNLSAPSLKTKVFRSVRSISKSVKLLTKKNNSNIECNKGIIDTINKTPDSTIDDGKKEKLINEFNEFIINDNCLDIETIKKYTDNKIPFIIYNNGTTFNNKMFFKNDPELLKRIFAPYFKKINKIEELDEIIDYYFGIYRQIEELPKPPDDDPNFKNEYNELVKRLGDIKEFNLQRKVDELTKFDELMMQKLSGIKKFNVEYAKNSSTNNLGEGDNSITGFYKNSKKTIHRSMNRNRSRNLTNRSRSINRIKTNAINIKHLISINKKKREIEKEILNLRTKKNKSKFEIEKKNYDTLIDRKYAELNSLSYTQ